MDFERHHHSAWIIASSMITVASFVGATAYTQNRLTRLDALSSTIETNAVPSIEHLSRAAVRFTRLSQLMDQIAESGGNRAAAVGAARDAVQALDLDIADYVRLPTLPGERARWSALRSDVGRALHLVRVSLDADAQGRQPPAGADQDSVGHALDAAVRSVVGTLDFDVGQAKAIARDVRGVRAAALRTIVSLDALATTVALFSLFVAYRASRRHDELLRAHNSLLATRVTELDRFAGRVAHDVLSPLGTVATALGLLAKTGDEQSRVHIDRSQRALLRVKQLVQGLLEFARAGARPAASCNCSLEAVLPAVVGDCSQMAAEKGIEVVIDATAAVHVPCSVGVITSIVQNLVQNAIKYMDVGPDKRVVVRTKGAGAMGRLEVEDTGPGIPADLQVTMFEPFMRGPREDVGGAGLGLATVKRLVESHGGTIGVYSKVGAGTLFWVEFPLVAPEAQSV